MAELRWGSGRTRARRLLLNQLMTEEKMGNASWTRGQDEGRRKLASTLVFLVTLNQLELDKKPLAVTEKHWEAACRLIRLGAHVDPKQAFMPSPSHVSDPFIDTTHGHKTHCINRLKRCLPPYLLRLGKKNGRAQTQLL